MQFLSPMYFLQSESLSYLFMYDIYLWYAWAKEGLRSFLCTFDNYQSYIDTMSLTQS